MISIWYDLFAVRSSIMKHLAQVAFDLIDSVDVSSVKTQHQQQT